MNREVNRFRVVPAGTRGHSLIQWGCAPGETRGLRSLQVETGIAHLWAAAPELLEVVSGFLAWADKNMGLAELGLEADLPDGSLVDQARAALAHLLSTETSEEGGG